MEKERTKQELINEALKMMDEKNNIKERIEEENEDAYQLGYIKGLTASKGHYSTTNEGSVSYKQGYKDGYNKRVFSKIEPESEMEIAFGQPGLLSVFEAMDVKNIKDDEPKQR